MDLQDLKSSDLIKKEDYKMVINIGVNSEGGYEFQIECSEEFKKGVFALYAVLPTCMNIIMDKSTLLAEEYNKRLKDKNITKSKPALDVFNSLLVELGYKK